MNVCLLRCESHGGSNLRRGGSGCLTVRLGAQEGWGWDWCGYKYSNNEKGGYPGCYVVAAVDFYKTIKVIIPCIRVFSYTHINRKHA